MPLRRFDARSRRPPTSRRTPGFRSCCPRAAIFSEEVRIFSMSPLAWPKCRWRSSTRSRNRLMSSISTATSRWIRCACSRICTSLRIACMVCTASISMFGAQMTIRARCAFCTKSEKCSAEIGIDRLRRHEQDRGVLRLAGDEIALGHGVDMAADIDPYAPRRVFLLLVAPRRAEAPRSLRAGTWRRSPRPPLLFGMCSRQSGRLPFDSVGWNE